MITLSIAIKNLKILVQISLVMGQTILRHSLGNATGNGVDTAEETAGYIDVLPNRALIYDVEGEPNT
jgi:hypothetical protein